MKEKTLKELRESLGLKQEDVGKKLGINQSAVSRIENQKNPKISTLKKYLEAIGAKLEINIRTEDGKVYHIQGDGVQKVGNTLSEET